MEYLEMRGVVKLKNDANQAEINSILNELQEIEFIDLGVVLIQAKNNTLDIDIEGTISEFHSTKVLLERLQCQLSETSMISITRERWEVFVVLRYWSPLKVMRLLPIEYSASP